MPFIVNVGIFLNNIYPALIVHAPPANVKYNCADAAAVENTSFVFLTSLQT